MIKFLEKLSTVEVLCNDGTLLSARLYRPPVTQMVAKEERPTVAEWDIHLELNTESAFLVSSDRNFGGVKSIIIK